MKNFIWLRKKVMKISLLILLCVSFFKYATFAQAKNLSGSVVDAKTLEPVSGVIVMVKGTKIETTTNSAGEFAVTAPGNSILVFSSIRFEEQELTPDISGIVNIKLVSNSRQQRDLFVVDHWIRTKRFLTGAVEKKIDDKIFAHRATALGCFAFLQGEADGVSSLSLQRGRCRNLQIKRTTSTNGSEPTIIIDGIRVSNLNAVKSFNSAEIENVSYLKDVAGSIYGARAAGGVLLITTQREKSRNLIIK